MTHENTRLVPLKDLLGLKDHQQPRSEHEAGVSPIKRIFSDAQSSLGFRLPVQPDRTHAIDGQQSSASRSKQNCDKGKISGLKMTAIAISSQVGTYFLPRQSLGPTLNGWNTALSSLWNSAGAFSSQRSGRNSVGRWKFETER
jgi:hypothetical protein